MIYLEQFTLPDEVSEFNFILGDLEAKRSCYSSLYPFKIFPPKEFQHIEFEPVTIFYGGNGSGKTTLLNVIAETLEVARMAIFNKSAFFEPYLKLCSFKTGPSFNRSIKQRSKIITSDDVFDFLLNLRNLNEGIDLKRKELLEEYAQAKNSNFQLRSLDDYDELKKTVDARKSGGSGFVKKRLMKNPSAKSNGESAFAYFTAEIKENAIYLLDEPENSLSAEMQLALLEFLRDSARFYGCQFIISTHSPFLLSMEGAKIYDLDSVPVIETHWARLNNVRAYYEFFKNHEAEFLDF